jgi:hypothetical protein
MEDCHTVKALVLAIVALSANCKRKGEFNVVITAREARFLIIRSRVPCLPADVLISALRS